MNHCNVKVKYRECGIAMFQLKSHLEHSKLSQTNNSLSLHDNPSDCFNEESQVADNTTGLEGMGILDEHVEVDAKGNISSCKGNQRRATVLFMLNLGINAPTMKSYVLLHVE